MDKITSFFRKTWIRYRNWLGDKVWYKNWKAWLSILAVMAIAGFGGEGEEVEGEEITQEEVVEKTLETKAVKKTLETEAVEKEPIEVEVSTRSVVEGDYVYIHGETNLPDYAKLMVTISNNDYRGQTKTIVEDGTFETEGFSEDGKRLLAGEYDLSISLSIPSIQDKKFVQEAGNDYEYLTGDLMRESDIGKSMDYSTTFEIESPEEVVETEPKPEVEPEEDAPREHRNALSSANDYLAFSSFSEKGLAEQLDYEGYPEDAVIYAIENVEVDYYEQALQAAKDYLDFSSFSDEGLKEQLIYEGYSDDQAQHAIDNLD